MIFIHRPNVWSRKKQTGTACGLVFGSPWPLHTDMVIFRRKYRGVVNCPVCRAFAPEGRFSSWLSGR